MSILKIIYNEKTSYILTSHLLSSPTTHLSSPTTLVAATVQFGRTNLTNIRQSVPPTQLTN